MPIAPSNCATAPGPGDQVVEAQLEATKMSFRSCVSSLTISALASATLLTASLSAQQPRVLAPHKPIDPRVEKSQEQPLPPARLGSLVGGPWMTDASFKSAIYLRNVVETSAITVTPILYLSNGAKYLLPNVTLEPAGTAIVDINSGLQSLGIASYATLSGYVEIQYNWPWMPICAMIRNVDTAHSLIFLHSMEYVLTGGLAT